VSWDDAKAFVGLADAEDRPETTACRARPSGNMRRAPGTHDAVLVGQGGRQSRTPIAAIAATRCPGPCARDPTGRTASGSTTHPEMSTNGVEDCWNDTYKNAPKDGSAWTQGQCRQRVIRGGSFQTKANSRHNRPRASSTIRTCAFSFAHGFSASCGTFSSPATGHVLVHYRFWLKSETEAPDTRF